MVTLVSSKQIGPLTWRLVWSSNLTAPVTFYITRNGLYVGSTQATTQQFDLVAGEDLNVGVYDVWSDVVAEAPLSGRLTLEWPAVADAASYRVEYTGGATLATVTAGSDPILRYSTPAIADGTAVAISVIPISSSGAEGRAVEFTGRIVCRPNVPYVAYSWTYDEDTELGEIVAYA